VKEKRTNLFSSSFYCLALRHECTLTALCMQHILISFTLTADECLLSLYLQPLRIRDMEKTVLEEVQPARCTQGGGGSWGCIRGSIYIDLYHQHILPVVGGGAMGGSLLVSFGSLACVGWKGGWGVFRQCSNGLQTVRTMALSHAEKAKTPLPSNPSPA